MKENKRKKKRITKLIRIGVDKYEILKMISKANRTPMSKLVDSCISREITMAKKASWK